MLENGGLSVANIPDAMAIWDYEKNNQMGIFPYNISIFDRDIMCNWKCVNGHTSQVPAGFKIRKVKDNSKRSYTVTKCDYCARKKVWLGETDAYTVLSNMGRYDIIEESLSAGVSEEFLRTTLYYSTKRYAFKCNLCGCIEYHTFQRRVEIHCKNCKHLIAFKPEIAVGIKRYNEFYNISDGVNSIYSKLKSDTIFHYRCSNGHDIHKSGFSLSEMPRFNGELKCPYCSGESRHIVYIDSSIKVSDVPEIFKYWDFEENNKKGFDPSRMSINMPVRVHWKCENGHSWQAQISGRKYRDKQGELHYRGCSECLKGKAIEVQKSKSISVLRPDLAEGMRRYNAYYGITDSNNPDKLSPSTLEDLCIRCENGHDTVKSGKHLRTPSVLTGTFVCSACRKEKLISLPKRKKREYYSFKPSILFKDYLKEHPEYNFLLDEWDYEENNKKGIFVDTVGKATKESDEISWICPDCKNSYVGSLSNRLTSSRVGNNCPYCAGRRVLKGFNDLATKSPEVAKEWDYEANYPLTPSDVYYAGNSKYHWVCEFGHKWESEVGNRTLSGSGCSKCISHGSSIVETAIYLALKDSFNNISLRGTKWGVEYDIIIEDKRLLIEYNGFWHLSKSHQEKDAQKVVLAKENNYTFLRIVETRDFSLCQGKKYNYVESDGILYLLTKSPLYIPMAVSAVLYTLNNNYGISVPLEASDTIEADARFFLKKKITEDSISTKFPVLVKYWHPTKNGDLKPDFVSFGSNYKAWWKCPYCGEEFRRKVSDMIVTKFICKAHCDLSTLESQTAKKLLADSFIVHYPFLEKYIDKEKNLGVRYELYPRASEKELVWTCPYCGDSQTRKIKLVHHALSIRTGYLCKNHCEQSHVSNYI